MTEATYRPVVGPAVQLPGGGVLQVRGAAAVGDQVFVRDGLIEGLAPALAIVSIDI